MSTQENEPNLIQISAKTFQSHFKRSHETIEPFDRNENVKSYCCQIIDLLTARGNTISLYAISKHLILTILQCAARVYEGDPKAKEEATRLITCKEFRIILNIGVQDKLLQAFYEHIASNKQERPNIEHRMNFSLRLATQQKTALQINNKAILIEQIASLCCNESAILQNVFEGARVDEAFMFRNYTTLVDALTLLEKSWLADLLPHIFQWSDKECGDAKASEHLVARCRIPSPASDALYTLDYTHPKGIYNNGEEFTRESFPSQCASPNSDRSCPDKDDTIELFPFSPEPYSNAATYKMTLPPLSDQPSKELQDFIRPNILHSDYVTHPTAAPDDEKPQQQAAIPIIFDAQASGETTPSFSDIKLKIESSQTLCEKFQFLEGPALMQRGLDPSQNKVTLAMKAVEINNKRRGLKGKKVLATIPEEPQEQRELGEEEEI